MTNARPIDPVALLKQLIDEGEERIRQQREIIAQLESWGGEYVKGSRPIQCDVRRSIQPDTTTGPLPETAFRHLTATWSLFSEASADRRRGRGLDRADQQGGRPSGSWTLSRPNRNTVPGKHPVPGLFRVRGLGCR